MSAKDLPLDASVLPFEAVRFHEEHNPEQPFYVIADEKNPGQVQYIKALEFSRASQRVAQYVQPEPLEKPGEIIAIFANVDNVLYHAIITGIALTGHIPFPVSPRNSPAAVISLLEKTKCSRLIVTYQTSKTLLDAVQAQYPVQLTFTEAPAFNSIFPQFTHETAQHEFKPYPPVQFARDPRDVAFYLHSSGSTGHPKPIAETHHATLKWMWQSTHNLTDLNGVKKVLSAPHLPPFHTMAVIIQLMVPLAALGRISMVMYPPQAPQPPIIPTPDNVLEHSKLGSANVIMTVPWYVEQWVNDEKAVEYLSTLDWISSSGGPTSEQTGDQLIAKGVNLWSIYGATEFGLATAMPYGKPPAGDLWNYFNFETFESSLLMLDRGEGRFELEVLETDQMAISVVNGPENKGYLTQDLFVEHPTKKHYWKIVGRADDVIILGTGEKVVPGPMEGILEHSELVNGAVYFGREKMQVGILIEPRASHPVDVADEEQVAKFRNELWSVVEEANHHGPSFAHIYKEAIVIAGRPFIRSPKGTVQRGKTLKEFENEINAMYEDLEASHAGGDQIPVPEQWDVDSTIKWLVATSLDLEGTNVDPEVDIFAQGFDSLGATHLRNRIVAGLRKSEDQQIQQAAKGIKPNFIFTNPTLQALAKSIVALIENHDSDASTADARKIAIESMIAKYSSDLKGQSPSSQPLWPHQQTVLITGTTGSLGSYLLESFIRSDHVETVYALNRPSKSGSVLERQTEVFEDRGFDPKLLSSPKVRLLEGDAATDAQLGLSKEVYEKIRNSVTIIIHNAWRLDFNLSLASFEPNIRGSRHLIDLGLSSSHAAHLRFLFTSTVATALGWDPKRGPFPEEVQKDATIAIGTGYGEGKYVVERILEASGLNATSFRIGQISGGKNGIWASSDWVPNIFKSSIAIGALPDSHGLISWTPLDVISGAIVDVALNTYDPDIALNLSHPKGIQWTKMITAVAKSLVKLSIVSEQLPTIPFPEWFAKIEAKVPNATEKDYEDIPALKLLDFFRGLSTGDQTVQAGDKAESGGSQSFDTRKMQAASSTLANAPPLNEQDVETWLTYWKGKGFFPNK